MNEETPSAESVTPAPEPPPSSPPDQPEPTTAKQRSGPSWPLLALLAVIPAVIVGAIVYFVAGGGGEEDSAPGVVDGFFRLGAAGPNSVQSFSGERPPGFPDEFPIIDGARTVAGFATNPEPTSPTQTPSQSQQPQGTSYFVILNTDASTDEVYNYYLDALTADPWQVEVARSSDQFTGIQFSRPDDPDVMGDVSIHHSELDDRTTIYVSFQDLTPDASSAAPSQPYDPGATRPMPPRFPSDISIYKDEEGTVVTDTYFQRDPGSTTFIITFVTKDSASDVIDYYRQEYEGRGWSVTDSAAGSSGSGFGIGVDFSDQPTLSIQGSVSADTLAEDTSYTRVDLLLLVSSSRTRGN